MFPSTLHVRFLTTVIIVGLSLTSFIDCFMTVKPTVLAAFIGERVALRCSTNSTDIPGWFHMPGRSFRYGRKLFQNNRILPALGEHYEIERSTKELGNTTSRCFDLVFKSIRTSDAGKYLCRDRDNFGDDYGTAELIVINGNSSYCRTNATDTTTLAAEDSVTIKCVAEYISDSNSTAVLDSVAFSLSNQDGVTLPASAISLLLKAGSNGHFIESTYSVDVETIDHVCCYQCLLNFTTEGFWSRTEVLGCNWPTSKQVGFPVRDVRIEHVRAIKVSNSTRLGDTIKCEADSNPPPKYIWTEVPTGRLVSYEPVLLLNETGDRKYRCTATNVIRNVTHLKSADVHLSVEIIDAEYQSSSSSNDDDQTFGRISLLILTFIVTAGVVFVAFVGSVIAVSAVRFARRRNLRRQAEAAEIAAEVIFRRETVSLD